MKKIWLFLVFLAILLPGFGPKTYALETPVRITEVSTLHHEEEYLKKETNEYSGFVDSIIRIHFTCDNTISYSVSSYYIEVINIDYTQGYMDIKLLNSGECILVLEEKNAITDEILYYDYLNITIYNEVTSLDISTVYNSVYENKKLVLDLIINQDENLFSSNIFFYYLDENGRKILLSEGITSENQLAITIDQSIISNDKITIYASSDDLVSNGLDIFIQDVSYLTYFDLAASSATFSLADETASLYIRIPLDVTPDFTLLDESNSVTLLNYEIVEVYPTFSLVAMHVRFNQAASNQRVLIGGMMDETRSYMYKEMNITIVDEITSIGIISKTGDLEFGEIITCKLQFNESIDDITCLANWYVNEELVSTGGTLNYQFYDSGYQYIRVEYQGYTADLRVYVGYSNTTTIVWYAALFGLILVVFPLLYLFSKRKKKKIMLIQKRAESLNDVIKKMDVKIEKVEINRIVVNLKSIISRCTEHADYVDNTYLDNAISEFKKINLMLQSLLKIEKTRYIEVLGKIQRKMEVALEVLDSASQVEKEQLKVGEKHEEPKEN